MATTTITGNFADLLATMHGALIATGKFENVADVDENTFACKKNDELLYLAFQPYTYRGTISYYHSAVVGLQIIVSSEWDTLAKIPAGTKQTLHLSLFHQGHVDDSQLYVALANPTTGLVPELMANLYEMTYYCDEYGLYANIKNPYNYGAIICSSSLVILEFIPAPAREYNDGNPSLCGTVITHPPVHADLKNANRDLNQVRSFIYNRNKLVYKSYRPAFKSTGNNKVYFEFPYYFNDPDGDYVSPIARSSRWFEVQKSASGLISGDTVSWLDVDGVSVRKFLITEISSGDGSHEKFFAIPYDNPKPYTAP